MFHLLAQVIFWFSVAALVYVYVGYPVLVYLVSLIFPKKIKRGSFQPKVTILITAYNEESAIRAKLENTLAIDYPPESLEILVASKKIKFRAL
jgi:cellulose synthase/poly-beta-1,6-N-acetylglucosamine synthase-like glycosyltransferase